MSDQENKKDQSSLRIRPSGSGAKKAPVKRRGKKKPVSSAVVKDAVELQKGLGTVVVRNEFYRDGYRALLRIAVLEAAVMFALIAIMFFVVYVNQKEYRYFATSEDGRLVPMVALNQPNLSPPALMSWVSQASTEVMTFGFHDYRRRLQEASRNFTRRGWESFTDALEKSRIIEMVEDNRQVVTAAPTSAPVLIQEGVFNGRYQWVVELPMNLTYQAGGSMRSDSLLLTLVVVRMPRLESPNGIGIERWIAIKK